MGSRNRTELTMKSVFANVSEAIQIDIQSLLLTYANDVLYRADKTGDQISRSIDKLKAWKEPKSPSTHLLNILV